MTDYAAIRARHQVRAFVETKDLQTLLVYLDDLIPRIRALGPDYGSVVEGLAA